jgi:hypothetical protein
MSNKNNYFAGAEEAVGRLLSFIVSLAFFSIYILSKTTVLLDWSGLLVHLAIFWLVYEVVSLVLFFVLNQFSRDKIEKLPIPTVDVNSTKTDQNKSDIF